MAKVHLTGELRRLCGGQSVVEVEASNVRQVVTRLTDSYPALADVDFDDLAVAVDGEVMANADFVAVGPDTEIHFLIAISGG